MATANIIVSSPITGSPNTAAWTYFPTRAGVSVNANPLLLRQVILTPQGILVTGNGTQVGFLMDDILAAAANVNMGLTTAPYVNTPPVNVVLNNAPTGCNFTITAYSEIPILSYQWQVSTNQGGTWANLSDTGVYSGSATDTLSVSNAAGVIGDYYRIIVTNALGFGQSSPAVISAITTEPSNTTVASPNATNFHVVASGASPLTYQWYFSNSVVVNSFGVYSNSTTNHLNISNSSGLSGTGFYCVVKDPTGVSNNSNVATLTVT
jgi:hypothetical protein